MQGAQKMCTIMRCYPLKCTHMVRFNICLYVSEKKTAFKCNASQLRVLF